MQTNAIPDGKIEPGRCFALVTTSQRLLEQHGIRETAPYVLVLGSPLSQERVTSPVSLQLLLVMLWHLRPLRITVDAGKDEDAAAIRSQFPPDLDHVPDFEAIGDVLIEARELLNRMKGNTHG